MLSQASSFSLCKTSSNPMLPSKTVDTWFCNRHATSCWSKLHSIGCQTSTRNVCTAVFEELGEFSPFFVPIYLMRSVVTSSIAPNLCSTQPALFPLFKTTATAKTASCVLELSGTRPQETGNCKLFHCVLAILSQNQHALFHQMIHCLMPNVFGFQVENK